MINCLPFFLIIEFATQQHIVILKYSKFEILLIAYLQCCIKDLYSISNAINIFEKEQ